MEGNLCFRVIKHAVEGNLEGLYYDIEVWVDNTSRKLPKHFLLADWTKDLYRELKHIVHGQVTTW